MNAKIRALRIVAPYLERWDTLVCFVLATLHRFQPKPQTLTCPQISDALVTTGRQVLGSNDGEQSPHSDAALFRSAMRWLRTVGFISYAQKSDGNYLTCKLTPIGLTVLQAVPDDGRDAVSLGTRVEAAIVGPGTMPLSALMPHIVAASILVRSYGYLRHQD